MSAQTIVIQLAGSGPYGFRLIGGDTAPLVVSRIRPYSKAQQQGVCEGDIVLGINGVSSVGLKHSTATGLTETDSLGVTLHLLRGPGGHRDETYQSAVEELRGQLRLLPDSEAARILEASGFGTEKIFTAASLASDSPPDSPISISSSSTPFKLQLPPSGGLKQMRNYRQQQSRDSTTSSPIIVTSSPAPSGMTQQYGQLNLKRDLHSLGNPAGEDPGYYSRQEQTFQEGDTTRKVTEEVSKDRFGGTTVTRVVKQEVSNRQIPVNERVIFDQPTFSIMAGPQKYGRLSGTEDAGDDWKYGSNLPVKVQTYNTSSNSWENSSVPQGGQQTYDFTTMIQELENSAPPASWQGSTGTNKGGTQHWNTTTSWNVGGESGSTDKQGWNGVGGGPTRPGAQIQIQFQPESSGVSYGTQYGGRSNQQPSSSYYQSNDSQYPFSSSSAAPSGNQKTPVIQVYSSNDDRPHVQLQTNSRVPQVEEKPFMTEEFITTTTKRYQTEEEGPVTVKSWSSSGPATVQQSKAPSRIGNTNQWNDSSNNGEVLARNESGSLTRSTSVQGAKSYNPEPVKVGRQNSQQAASFGERELSSYPSWKEQTPVSAGVRGQAGHPLQSQRSHPGGHDLQSGYSQQDDYSQNNGGFGTNQRAVPAGPGGFSQQGPSQVPYQKQNSWSANPKPEPSQTYGSDPQQFGQQGYQADDGYPQSGPQSYQQGGPQGYQQGGPQGYQGGPQGYQQGGPQSYQGGSQGYQGGLQGHQEYPGQQGPQNYQGYQQGGPQGYQQGGPQNYQQGGPSNYQGYQPESYQGPQGPQSYQQAGNQQWGPQGYQQHPGGPSQGYGGYQQGNDYYGGGPPGGYQAPPPPPPPMAPPPPPPSNKNPYGPQAEPQRVEVAKVVAHSVLAPENSRSKGQQMFLRRMAQSEKWSTGQGGDPSEQSGGYGGEYAPAGNANSWNSPSPSGYESHSPRPQPRQGGIGAALTSEDMTGGRGGQLFAKKKERADRWAAADDQRQAGAGRGRVVIGTAVPQQQQQQQQMYNSYQPIKMNVSSVNNYSAPPTNQYGGPSNQKYAFTDL